eukprot:UN05702
MTNAGFKGIARQLSVGHAWSWPVRWNCPVEVFGRKVNPGDLIHADKHGFLVIPKEDEAKLLEASTFMDRNECETIIPASRGSMGLSFPEKIKRLNDGGARFGKNAKRKFGGEGGEWAQATEEEIFKAKL